MKNLKKFLVVAFAFLTTLTISGCGKSYAKSNLSANEAFEKSITLYYYDPCADGLAPYSVRIYGFSGVYNTIQYR